MDINGSVSKSRPEEMYVSHNDAENLNYEVIHPEQVKVAILGEPEVGKTTFRRIMEQELPAKCNILFRDLPCLEQFSRDEFINKVQLFGYDFYVIIGSNRIHENDIWLAKEISKNHAMFYYVRSKLDEALQNNRRSKPKTHLEDDVIHKIRQYCQATFQDENLGSVPIFLISNHDPDKWDFQRLKHMLVDDTPRAKAESERRLADKMNSVQSSSLPSWLPWPLNSCFN